MNSKHVNNTRLGRFIYYFTIYSFLGWTLEMVYTSLSKRTFANVGFLYGPFCPVYGFGVILLLLLLYPVKSNLVLFFTGAVVLTSALEYATGILLKLVFNRTWWSYSDIAFNLGGFICLRNSIIWGIVSVFIARVLHPIVRRLVLLIPDNIIVIASRMIILYFAVDLLITVNFLVLSGYERKFLAGFRDSIDNNIVYVKHLAHEIGKSFVK